RSREPRQDHERHPRLSHDAGRGGGDREGRGREAPAVLSRDPAPAGARARRRVPRRRLEGVPRRRDARARRHADLAAQRLPGDPGVAAVKILRTPEERFARLPFFPWAPHYLDDLPGYEGMRLPYRAEGPEDAR